MHLKYITLSRDHINIWIFGEFGRPCSWDTCEPVSVCLSYRIQFPLAQNLINVYFYLCISLKVWGRLPPEGPLGTLTSSFAPSGRSGFLNKKPDHRTNGKSRSRISRKTCNKDEHCVWLIYVCKSGKENFPTKWELKSNKVPVYGRYRLCEVVSLVPPIDVYLWAGTYLLCQEIPPIYPQSKNPQKKLILANTCDVMHWWRR